MPPKLFFFHNPKAGGSSVAQALRALFPKTRCSPLIENTEREHQERAGDYAAFAGFDLYDGHYGRDIYEAVASGHAPVTNFREPAARLLSLYNYYRVAVPAPEDPSAQDNLYPVLFAQNVGFREFVASDDPRLAILTQNHHTRQLTHSGWSLEPPGDLSKASDTVDRMVWFFLCEDGDRCQDWGSQVFGPGFAVPWVNATARTGQGRDALAAIDVATRRIVASRNELDSALHAYAAERLRRRHAQK